MYKNSHWIFFNSQFQPNVSKSKMLQFSNIPHSLHLERMLCDKKNNMVDKQAFNLSYTIAFCPGMSLSTCPVNVDIFI